MIQIELKVKLPMVEKHLLMRRDVALMRISLKVSVSLPSSIYRCFKKYTTFEDEIYFRFEDEIFHFNEEFMCNGGMQG